MKQSLVIKTHVPKALEQITAVPMVSYREKDEKRFVLKSNQVRPEDYYLRFTPHVPE